MHQELLGGNIKPSLAIGAEQMLEEATISIGTVANNAASYASSSW